jgi:hypothetical protein
MSEEMISAEEAVEKEQMRAAVATWHYRLSANVQDAVQFVNRPPAQVAGQAVFSVRDSGQVDTFYFL